MAREFVSKTALWKAIREKCLDCSAYQTSEVKKCPVDDCSLYPFRLGQFSATRKITMNSDSKTNEKHNSLQDNVEQVFETVES